MKILAVSNCFLRRLATPSSLACCFLLCTLLTGLGCALLSPVGLFPDELVHAAQADGLRHGNIFSVQPPAGYPAFTIGSGVMVNAGIYRVLVSPEYADAFPDRALPESDRQAAEALRWGGGQFYYPSQTMEYFPGLLIPAAFGLATGETLGLTPLHTYFLGRVMMLLAFAALGTAAIALARNGNLLLFAVLTLPSIVNLSASYNPDALMSVCGALAASLLTRCRPGVSHVWFAALALLTIIAITKIPYAGMLLLALPPLLAPGRLRRAGFLLLACVPPGVWLLHITHVGLIAYQRGRYHPGPLWPGPHDIWLDHVIPRDNFLVLLAHPLDIFWLPLSSFVIYWHEAWRMILGLISCDLVLISPWEYPCLAVALVTAAALATLQPPPAGWRGLDGGFAALVLFLAFIGMETSMYITFNDVGMASIGGVASRYYLPFLPFFIFLLPCAGTRLPGADMLRRIPAGWFCLPAIAMAVVNVFALPAFVFHVFHMPGP